jgi:beta-N-acetylhexosaminidase
VLAAIVQALTLLLSGSVEAEVAAMTPQQKAAAVVVAGMPAGPGFGGVLVRQWNTGAVRPRGALVFADQEGGTVKAFRSIAPWQAASAYRSAAAARAAGAATAAALRREGVNASFAPVLDLPDGPLGSRHFARPEYAVAFARGLGRAACVKHFPGLGSTRASTDVARVYGVLRSADLAPFRAAIRAGVPCVMVGHAIYPRLGRRRASLEPKTYALLRELGFDGVAITDSLGILHRPWAPYWAKLALRAGADLVLTTSAADARRMVEALVPLAEAGELDAKLVRVLRYRRLVATAG